MLVMVPLQLKFIEGKTYSVLLEVEGSSALTPAFFGPYMFTVSLDRNPRAQSIWGHETRTEWDMVYDECGLE